MKHLVGMPVFGSENLASCAISLDKSKSFMSNKREQDWAEVDQEEEEYLNESSQKQKKRNERDSTDKALAVSNPLTKGGYWYSETANRKERKMYFRPFLGKI